MSCTVPRPFLAVRGVCKSFPGVRALDGVDLEIAAGSIHALVGENGAGKSTLVRILAGALRPDAGRIELDGRQVVLRDPYAAQRAGIAVVHQELSLAADLSVAENVFLGRWPRRPGTPLVDFPRLHAEAASVLASLGVDVSVAGAVRELSVAQQQLVEIARALSLASRLLVLDEPSAVLTPHELQRLFGIVRGLRDRGVAVIYISHRLEEIFTVADRVTVLRDGRVVATHAVCDVDRDRLVAEMVGRDVEPPRHAEAAATGVPVLRVEGLGAGRRFRDVSFAVHAGEVFALTGLVGSGRSSVLHAIFGAVRATAGRVTVGGAVGPFPSPYAAIRVGVALVPEDRKLQGLLLGRSVRENASLARLGDFSGVLGLVDRKRERAAVRSMLGDLRVKAANEEVAVATLSGGNQQKVLLGRWMGWPHRVVLLDEPTRGVDVGAKAEIHALVGRLAREGAAVVVASSEFPETIALADRIGVLCEGRLAAVLDNAARDVDPETILRLAAGGAAA